MSKEAENQYGSLNATEAEAFVKYGGKRILDYSRKEIQELRKYAEEGHWSWSALGSIAGILITLNGLLGFVDSITDLSPILAVLNIYVFFFGILLVILERKDFSFTKDIQKLIKSEALFLYRPYGRGTLYIFLGALVACKGNLFNLILGLAVRYVMDPFRLNSGPRSKSYFQ